MFALSTSIYPSDPLFSQANLPNFLTEKINLLNKLPNILAHLFSNWAQLEV